MDLKTINVKKYLTYLVLGAVALIFLGTSLPWYAKVATFALVAMVVVVKVFILRGRPAYVLFKGKSFQEWTRTWGTFGCWISFWAVLITLKNTACPGFAKQLLLGWDLPTAGFWLTQGFVYLGALGTWGSWGGDGARKFGTWLNRGLWFFLFLYFMSQIINIPYSDRFFQLVLKDSQSQTRNRSFSTPARYFPSAYSPAPRMIQATVVPQGKDAAGAWIRHKLCDLPAGTNQLTITYLGGRIRAAGRTTWYEDGKLFAEVTHSSGTGELVPLKPQDSPLRLVIGEWSRVVSIAAPDTIPVTVTKSTPLYTFYEVNDKTGTGLVKIDISY